MQAHFELTDVSVPVTVASTVTTKFRSSRIWQKAPDELDVPEFIELKDKVLVSVGECDVNCEHFLNSENFVWLTSHSIGENGILANLAKDIYSLRVGKTLIANHTFFTSSDSDSMSTPPSDTLNRVTMILISDQNSSSINFVAHMNAKFFVQDTIVEESTDGRQAWDATNLSMVKPGAASAWTWNSVVTAQVFSGFLQLSPSAGVLIGFASSEDPCLAVNALYNNDVPVEVKNTIYRSEKCKEGYTTAYSRVINQFLNGQAGTVLDSRTTSSIAFDNSRANVFTESNRLYSDWSVEPSYVRCREPIDDNCLSPVFDNERRVSKLKVNQQSPLLNTYSFEPTPSPTHTPPDSFQMYGVSIQSHSDIVLYPQGMVKSFVTDQELKGNFKGRAISVPAGMIVELDQKGYLTSFHP